MLHKLFYVFIILEFLLNIDSTSGSSHRGILYLFLQLLLTLSTVILRIMTILEAMKIETRRQESFRYD